MRITRFLAAALTAAERLRAAGPPSWETLVASVGHAEL